MSVRIEFGNVVLRFSADEFERFDQFVSAIDIDRCERVNAAHYRRIAIDLQDTGVTLTFTRQELIELRALFQEVSEDPICDPIEDTRRGTAFNSVPVEWAAHMLN